jgi:hypothetical protein
MPDDTDSHPPRPCPPRCMLRRPSASPSRVRKASGVTCVRSVCVDVSLGDRVQTNKHKQAPRPSAPSPRGRGGVSDNLNGATGYTTRGPRLAEAAHSQSVARHASHRNHAYTTHTHRSLRRSKNLTVTLTLTAHSRKMSAFIHYYIHKERVVYKFFMLAFRAVVWLVRPKG